ncbi:MAG: desulfoferrodoxin [Oscillospiraceae bacterium]|jgi:superoxide reductase|nr:desulfoferrodoxin [Oscillospiraceae bacterium]
MAQKLTFFRCAICGKIEDVYGDEPTAPICCGQPMSALTPNTTDAAQEKHVPVATLDGDSLSVQVGSVLHPMQDNHFIEWIYVQTETGKKKQILSPGDAPTAVFNVAGAKPVAVYEYCNLHGLWSAAING